MGDLVTFRNSIFTDAHNRAITSTYEHAYFAGVTFTVHESTVKIEPLKNFLLFGVLECQLLLAAVY